MIEAVLYFALGFFSAALLALMISPAIWNRAVTLTRKRVESSVPLTLNEVQADKDQLRAEFAMSTRRLEMSIEELREKATRQVIDISRKRDELARLMEESRERIRTIEELEARSSELRAMLKEREDKLADANRQLAETNHRMEAAARELEMMRSQFGDLQFEVDSSRIELVAKQTEMDNLSDRYTDALDREKELKARMDELAHETEEARRERDEIAMRQQKLEKEIADNRRLVEQREIELARLREFSALTERSKEDIAARLTELTARNVELEAKLAQSALTMEALLNDASNDNVEKAMASLTRDKENLEAQLAEIRAERDRLRAEQSGQRRRRSEDWEVERRENAILRERINDLAAQVTAMTAALEGDNSAINELLAAVPKEIHVAGKSYAARAEDDTDMAAGAHKTLADRIRALQEGARQNKAV